MNYNTTLSELLYIGGKLKNVVHDFEVDQYLIKKKLQLVLDYLDLKVKVFDKLNREIASRKNLNKLWDLLRNVALLRANLIVLEETKETDLIAMLKQKISDEIKYLKISSWEHWPNLPNIDEYWFNREDYSHPYNLVTIFCQLWETAINQ